jgi:hypothetical protein
LLGDLPHQLLHLGTVRLLPAVRQDPGPQLHYQARDIFDYLRAHAQLIAKSVPECRTPNPTVAPQPGVLTTSSTS